MSRMFRGDLVSEDVVSEGWSAEGGAADDSAEEDDASGAEEDIGVVKSIGRPVPPASSLRKIPRRKTPPLGVSPAARSLSTEHVQSRTEPYRFAGRQPARGRRCVRERRGRDRSREPRRAFRSPG